MDTYQVIKYDLDLYPFRETVQDLLGEGLLENLHDETVPRLTRKTDQGLRWQEQFYAGFSGKLKLLYELLVREVVRPYFEEAIVYQEVPTFRVQLPGNLAVGEWHRDADYGHALHELNFWLPLTDAWGSNSVWIEDGATFVAVNAYPGQVVIFEGARLIHGNVPNVTGQARVSFDFRAYPYRLHSDRDSPTVTGRRRFVLGDYWSLLD